MKVNEMRFLVVDPHGVRRESRVAILLVAIPRRMKFSIQNFKKFQWFEFRETLLEKCNFSTRINDDSGHLGIIFQNLELFSKWTVLPFQIFFDIFSDQLGLLEIDP